MKYIYPHIEEISALWFVLLGFGLVVGFNLNQRILKPISRNFIVLFLIVLLSSFILVLIRNFGEQQFIYLSKSFLQGRLDITQYPDPWSGVSYFKGKYFWPLGPFPAVILMPFVYIFDLFNRSFPLKYVQVPLVFAIFFLWVKIARKFSFNYKDSLYLGTAFIFASCFIDVGLYPWSWQFAQVVAVFLILIAIYEYLTRKRYLFLGAIYGLLLLTRISASLGIIFFILDIIYRNLRITEKAKDLAKLLTPYLLALMILGLYNYLRFGILLEQGYSYQLAEGAILKARDYGLFGLIHIPGNLYNFLMASPSPVLKDGVSYVLAYPYIKYQPWGLSIFFTSPYFVYLVFLKYKDRISKFLWITSGVIALPIFLYYGIGVSQFGYRYSLDFLPYLFLLLIRNYKKQRGNLSSGFKLVIIISVMFNLYLLATFKV
jgi:hypothetical protein